MNFVYAQFKSSRQTILFLGGSKDEPDLSVKTTAVWSVYEKPILVNKPLYKGTFNPRNMSKTREQNVPYYRKLTLHEIKVLEINAT